MLVLRQLGALVWKNILIALVRHPATTVLRAFVLPVLLGWFLSCVFAMPASPGASLAMSFAH